MYCMLRIEERKKCHFTQFVFNFSAAYTVAAFTFFFSRKQEYIPPVGFVIPREKNDKILILCELVCIVLAIL